MDSKNWNIVPKRICKYCGWDVDESDLEVLSFFHQDCWKNYRKLKTMDNLILEKTI